MKIVSGVYRDAPTVTETVRTLLARSVPADSIGVRIRAASGKERQVRVGDEAGVLEGAMAGAMIGAVLGALVVGLVTFATAIGEDGALASAVVASAGGGLAGIAAGSTLGAVIGLGRWKGLPELDREALGDGSIVVSVHSDALADVARSVLAESGAEELHEGDAPRAGFS